MGQVWEIIVYNQKHSCDSKCRGQSWPVEQLLIWQEVIDPWDVDKSKAEHRNVGVGCENPGDARREGHRQVARDLHQAAGANKKHTNRVKFNPVNSVILLTSIQQINIVDVIEGELHHILHINNKRSAAQLKTQTGVQTGVNREPALQMGSMEFKRYGRLPVGWV